MDPSAFARPTRPAATGAVPSRRRAASRRSKRGPRAGRIRCSPTTDLSDRLRAHRRQELGQPGLRDPSERQRRWIDARIQRFNRIGNYPCDRRHAAGAWSCPRSRPSMSQELAARLGPRPPDCQAHRHQSPDGPDARPIRRACPYGFVASEGTKAHRHARGRAWENQYILPGGSPATPYLGARLDAPLLRPAPAGPAPLP